MIANVIWQRHSIPLSRELATFDSTMDYINIFSAVVAIVAAVVAYRALTEERRITKWTTSYSRLREAEQMLAVNPSLLELHGVTVELLKENDVTAEEVVYLLLSFRAGQEAERIDKSGEIGLSPYRQQMLRVPKVARIWNNILHDRLLFRTEFVDVIDAFVESHHVSQESQITTGSTGDPGAIDS